MAYSKEKKDEIFNYVFEQITKGKALRNILFEENMPPAVTFFEWLSKDEEKAKQYAYACDLRAEYLFDEIIDIADDKSDDIIITKDGNKVLNNEFVQRSRVKIDARKWIISKLNPKKFGDKIDHTTNGNDINIKPIEFTIIDANTTTSS